MNIDDPIQKLQRRFQDPGELDPRLWEELGTRDPDEICVGASVRFERERGCYLVPFLNRRYGVFPGERLIERQDSRGEEELSFQLYLVLVTYLLRAQSRALSGRMVTGAELRGGGFFFRGHHALFTEPLERRFGSDPEGFLGAGLRLGGCKTDFGDASFRLWPLPRIPLGCILWAAVAEFSARVGVVFDASVVEHLALDVIWALVNEVGRALLKEAKSREQGAED
ncbi:MAG TPA: DUF3786 domain-containing protein [Syntrophobacteria bacterium]|nr:DUF3786 domain-containing protein [Syntrophobacteria bacterium]